MNILPEEFHDLLSDETRAFVFIATSMADDSPQVTPVWFDVDDQHVLINTNEGRTKERNMKARPKVALVIQDPQNPYRYVQIRGTVAGWTTEGADEHIDRLAHKYTGKPWKYHPEQKRIIFQIMPEYIDAH